MRSQKLQGFFFYPLLTFSVGNQVVSPVSGKERSGQERGTDRRTDKAKLIAQLNAIWKARSPRISA